MNKIYTAIFIGTLLIGQMAYGQLQPEQSKEQFIMAKLQQIVESKRPIQINIGLDGIKVTDENNSKQKIISTLTHLAGITTGITIMLKFNIINPPHTFWEFLRELAYFSFGAAIGSGILSIVYRPVIDLFVTLFYNLLVNEDAGLNRDVITEFIGHWNEYKPNVPNSLHETCDTLYVQYINNGGHLDISEQDANQLINTILINCLKAHTQKPGDVAA